MYPGTKIQKANNSKAVCAVYDVFWCLWCWQQVEEVLVLQKRITQIQNDKSQAQSQLSDATDKLDTIQKQLNSVS